MLWRLVGTVPGMKRGDKTREREKVSGEQRGRETERERERGRQREREGERGREKMRSCENKRMICVDVKKRRCKM